MAEAAPIPTASLDDLQLRLDRLEHAITGNATPSGALPGQDSNAISRLHSLEHRLHQLSSRSPAAREILDLQKSHPALFASPISNPTTILPPASLAALLLAHADLITTLSSQLSTLQSNSTIPNSTSLAKLSSLQPRLDVALSRQEAQANEFAELRVRSANVVEQWYENGVLGMGGKWSEWEERMRDVEILVRRAEGARRRELEGGV